MKYNIITTSTALTIQPNTVYAIELFSNTTGNPNYIPIAAYIVNRSDINIPYLISYITQWYSGYRLTLRNPNSTAITIPADTGIVYYSVLYSS